MTSTMSIDEAFRRYRKELTEGRGAEQPHAMWLWNMDVSFQWGGRGDYPVSGAGGGVGGAGDRWPGLGLMNALLAEPGDVLAMELDGGAGYDEDLLAYWREIGIVRAQPSFLAIERGAGQPSIAESAARDAEVERIVRERGVGTLICFGNGPQEEKLAASLGLALFGGSAESAAICNNKAVVKQWCIELGLPSPEGFICRSPAEVERAAGELLRRFDKVAIKDPFGASGKGILLVGSPERAARVLERARRGAISDVPIVVEGWYERTASHNTQLLVMPGGDVVYLGHTEQILDAQKYRGNRVPRDFDAPVSEALHDMHLTIARRAREARFTGLLGIDSFFTPDGITIPVIELNARLNLSTYALAALQKLGKRHEACLKSYLLRRREPVRFGEFFGGERPLYEVGATQGVLPLSFTGATTPRTEGILRVVLLFLGETAEQIDALRSRWEMTFDAGLS